MPTPRKEETAPDKGAEKEVKDVAPADVKKEEKSGAGEAVKSENAGTGDSDTIIKGLQADLEKSQETINGYFDKDKESDQKIQELQSESNNKSERIKELEAETAQKSEVIQGLSKKLNEFEKLAKDKSGDTADETVEKQNSIATVEVKEAKADLRKVKFLKDHTFSVSTTTINAKKGDVKEVDLFIANKLSQRSIATIL